MTRSKRSILRPVANVWVLVLLGSALVGAAALTREAYVSARSHRLTSEAALTDYAAFAAWEFDAKVRGTLLATGGMGLMAARRAAMHMDGRGTMSCECGAPPPYIALFLVDTAARTLTITEGSLDSGTAAWARDTVTADAGQRPPTDPAQPTFVFGTVGDREHGIVYAPQRATPGPALVGLVLDLSRIGDTVIAPLLRQAPLLPRSLTGGAPNDSLLWVTVATPGGHVLYQSRSAGSSPFVARDTLAGRFGAVVLTAALRPDVAPDLVIGGIPASHLSWQLLLLGVVTTLIGIAAWLFRREQQLTRMREDFVASVSHELRTPLAQILMDAETLQLGRVRGPGERQEAVDTIVREAERLKQLVENVLHVASHRRGNRELPESIELDGVVRETVASYSPIADRAGTTVVFEPERPATAVVAPVDRGSLRQMLLNVLDNAVKYGPRAQTVTVRLDVPDAAEPRARITVDDQGPGVPPLERERIWEPFVRLDRAMDAVTTGSGIGLAVVRDLAARYGGRAWVEDAPAGGARFVIELPVANAQVA